MKSHAHIPLSVFQEYPPAEMVRRAAGFNAEMQRRRTVRQFSDRAIPSGVIENCLRAAGSSPSGANLQPWTFVVVSDAATKRVIREAAEREEKEFYTHRAPAEWLAALAPFGTDEEKPYLETAPCLIAIFTQKHGVLPDGGELKHYYAAESVGIATGLLIAALHHSGLATLTHTPSPMGFLNATLKRPVREKPFLLLVAGYPATDATVPDIRRKPLEETTIFFQP
jgi:nitroreductase